MSRARLLDRLCDGLLLALGSLTAVRVPPPRRVDRTVAGLAMGLAVVPGLLLAAAWAGVSLAGRAAGLPSGVVGLLGVATLLLLTRAFHADGLADTVDGLTASYDRDRTLEVMRTGDIGPAGAAALVVVLGLDAACLAALHADGRVTLGVVAVVASRAVLAVACRRGVPSARPDGLGALVAGSVPPWGLAVVLALVAVVAVVVAGPQGAAVVAVACLAAEAVLRRARSRVGGVTGDVLGACVEVALAAGLVAAVIRPA